MRAVFLRITVLLVWAGFFGWLLISDEVDRYLGPRTIWVVVFGTITLTTASVLAILRSRAQSMPLNLREGIGLLFMIAPVLVTLTSPNPSLGALAAERKSLTGVSTALAPPPPGSTSVISFREIHFASVSSEYGTAIGAVPGRAVELEGFIAEVTTPESVVVARFYVSCCAADAIAYRVRVLLDGTQNVQQDDWVRVEGALAMSGDELAVEANEFKVIEEAEDPYLY